ncbi:MAG: YebC/PmpR family DNA-binding transcriptional regulator [Parcubacteria group bacterium]|nr:MAG: YebC/PmpR family DNA-binding transcriptional regulator [Parcubacteria group bacterium]
MSGHSKWATTKRAKAVVDAKRSSLFTKLTKNIMVAAREGVDPEMNFRLRIAVDKARVFNMPKDNIERAIKKGSGTGDGQTIETLLYEAYGPEGVALLIELLTDNKNRAASNIKHLLAKHNGKLGGEGSVRWMFEAKGQIILAQNKLTEDEELAVIEAGAEDVLNEEPIRIIAQISDLEKVKNNIQDQGFKIESSELTYLAKEKITPHDPDKLLSLLNDLDDDDDVNNIFTNADI